MMSGVGVGGCGVYSLRSGAGWFGRIWGHLDLLLPNGNLGLERCVLFDSIRGPLQSVQCAELCGVILALQCPYAVHQGVDNLSVVRHVFRILDGRIVGLLSLLLMGIFLPSLSMSSIRGVLIPSESPRLRVTLMMTWLQLVVLGLWTKIGLPTLAGAGSLTWLWTYQGDLSLPVPFGTLLSWIRTASLSPSLVLLSTTMGVLGCTASYCLV